MDDDTAINYDIQDDHDRGNNSGVESTEIIRENLLNRTEGDASSFSNSPDSYPPLYVAGYLALYGRDGTGELTMDRSVATAAIPIPAPLPINIDHRQDCVIGAVLTIVDDPDKGLFFLGKINCPILATILLSAASGEIFGNKELSLTPEERLLYIVTNYLPSASLSSRRLKAGEEPDTSLFSHVALCLLGRRVGTIVTYDISPENALLPFRDLSDAARRAVLSESAEAETTLFPSLWSPSDRAISRALLGTAVNTMLLRDRWRVVTERRKQAGIRGHTYLQASACCGFGGQTSKEEEYNGVCERRHIIKKVEAQLPGSIRQSVQEDGQETLLPENLALSSSPSIVRRQQSTMTTDSNIIRHPPQISRGQNDDYIWVPVSQYNNLVSNQRGSNTGINNQVLQQTSQSPWQAQMNDQQHHRFMTAGSMPYPGPIYGQPVYFQQAPFVQGGQLPIPYQTTQPSSLETQIAALIGAIAADRRGQAVESGDPHHAGGVDQSQVFMNQRRGRKRPYANDDQLDGDNIYYPGESVYLGRGSIRGGQQPLGQQTKQYMPTPPQYSGPVVPTGQGNDDNATSTGPLALPSDTICNLLGAVVSLHNEVSRLRQTQAVQTANVAQPQQADLQPQTAVKSVMPSYEQINAGPPQPMTTQQAQPHTKSATTSDMVKADPPAQTIQTENVDASAVVAIGGTTECKVDRDAEEFIAQMMCNRC
ncbi:UL26 [anatid alphaherpesvirus 1]|uniref:Capsid scaffolding protein n=2 Tax=anatid alphaherpesvirus 1 TaxID=104388 RepID=A2TIV8_9ALPH|nr:UL26 [Anatid alphaherpesvirus 1]YP_010795349.1 UL26 [Anatid alphaherpesvirus 1]AHD45955.1 UL26 [BAC cloning vector pDEV-vac]QWQ49814.1 UL26 [BAC cloning vector pDEV-CHa]ABM92125.1 UL26 protein [Anatid alphaherpesvirus 1]ABO26213.1 UL26-like [Anatid alphaherpesvirus 1]ABU49737.1 UL26 [Anatid alphaherpesvirus 1]